MRKCIPKSGRDALLTGASDIMSSAWAGTAWSENIGADQRGLRSRNQRSKLQMLKNQAIATGISFRNAMTPHLEAAMGAISNIIKGFEGMDAGQQQMDHAGPPAGLRAGKMASGALLRIFGARPGGFSRVGSIHSTPIKSWTRRLKASSWRLTRRCLPG